MTIGPEDSNPTRDDGSTPEAPTRVGPGGLLEESRTIGPYRLLRHVGTGGMGEVYLAEQTAPVRRQVALKVIKAGMDTKQVIARFEAERQALALMDHPVIAKVFDGGATPGGRPYFVMEFVKGEPITQYCDRNLLTTRERLALFLRVCDGVHHAHQKGIIHRDLKPSNVLVTVDGDMPSPKIIDFGVAKATSQPLTERTMVTELGAIIGTPEYMSPEQADLGGLDIDTRTDVYSLGVMLYELLTGSLPLDPRELRQAGLSEIHRSVREIDPPRPSARVRTLGGLSADSAKNRRTDPGRLAGHLKGDLDWITMRALEKDRTRRYGSPSDLKADIERHLADQPVLAGPPSVAYRARKFVRRHRVGVLVATVGVVALVAFSATMAVQTRRIGRERDRAERVSAFLVDLFRVSDPGQSRGKEVTAREILDRGAEKIDKELASQPEVQGRLLFTMGVVYDELGLYEKAIAILGKSVEVRSRILGPDHPDTLTSKNYLGVANEHGGHDQEAFRLYREVMEGRRRVLGPDHPLTIFMMNNVATALENEGKTAEAEAMYRDAIERATKASGKDDVNKLFIQYSLAHLLSNENRLAESEAVYREVVEGRRKVLGADHPETLRALRSLGTVFLNQKRFDEAVPVLRETCETTDRVLGPAHMTALVCRQNLGRALAGQGRFDEGAAMVAATYEGLAGSVGPRHPYTLNAARNLASLYATAGKKPEAIGWLRRAVDGGYRDAEGLLHDPDFASLRGDPAFERVVAASRKNAADAAARQPK